ncbi:hypothetical protein ACFOVU_15645 [Nocardiopsis sediminis]|uniref:DUF695 domain-containing protein n=1 Tax=Nocardiopsis sediminis TaxID=1778267 RepID=A0ABV8FPR9_9ACTN
MGVSIYYTARRDQGLTPHERGEVEGIADQGTRDLFGEIQRRLPQWREAGVVPAGLDDAAEVCEGLGFYRDAALEAGVVLAGSSKLSHGRCGTEVMLVQIDHYVDLLADIRRAVPEAAWRVHIEDSDLVWRDGRYHLPQ